MPPILPGPAYAISLIRDSLGDDWRPHPPSRELRRQPSTIDVYNRAPAHQPVEDARGVGDGLRQADLDRHGLQLGRIDVLRQQVPGQARGRVDANHPQISELPLAVPPVPVAVGQRPIHRFLRAPEAVLALAPVSFRLFQDAVPSPPCLEPTLCAWHDAYSSLPSSVPFLNRRTRSTELFRIPNSAIHIVVRCTAPGSSSA